MEQYKINLIIKGTRSKMAFTTIKKFRKVSQNATLLKNIFYFL